MGICILENKVDPPWGHMGPASDFFHITKWVILGYNTMQDFKTPQKAIQEICRQGVSDFRVTLYVCFFLSISCMLIRFLFLKKIINFFNLVSVFYFCFLTKVLNHPPPDHRATIIVQKYGYNSYFKGIKNNRSILNKIFKARNIFGQPDSSNTTMCVGAISVFSTEP